MTPNDEILTPLLPWHVPQMADIEQRCFSEEAWSESTLASELRNELAHYFVLTCGETVLAYVGTYVVADEMHISNVATEPSFRRCGYGARVLAAALEYAALCGVRVIHLEVREGNAAARMLYESHGFLTVGRRPHYYVGPDEAAILMTKEL